MIVRGFWFLEYHRPAVLLGQCCILVEEEGVVATGVAGKARYLNACWLAGIPR